MTTEEFVTEVIDGDTFRGNYGNPSVRLAGVDVPELGTPEGDSAKTFLEKLIYGELVSIETIATDVYGRHVANVKLVIGNVSVNQAMKRIFNRN